MTALAMEPLDVALTTPSPLRAISAPEAEVDAPSAVEFMREALVKISEDELAATAGLLAQKRERFAPHLADGALAGGAADAVRPILAAAWATRRRADDILVAAGAPVLAEGLRALLHGGGDLAARFTAFDELTGALEPPLRRDLAGECLHYHEPEAAWLWSRWMWDPATATGALPLVMVDGFDFAGTDAGGIYLRVGEATAAVRAVADDLGYRRMRESPFVVDVYLAAIYGVYLYTVTRLRMTQEFNRVIPPLPDLIRRLHGVRDLDGEERRP
jgi:hypothetical protein